MEDKIFNFKHHTGFNEQLKVHAQLNFIIKGPITKGSGFTSGDHGY